MASWTPSLAILTGSLARRRGTRARPSRRRASAAGRQRRGGTRRRPPAGACGSPASGGRPAWRRRSSCRSPAGRTSMMTLGMRLHSTSLASVRPISSVSSSSTILMTFWRRREASRAPPASRQRSFGDCATNDFDDLEVDVRLQKRHAYLAHGVVDVVLGQAALAAQAGEYALQAVRRGFSSMVGRLLFRCCVRSPSVLRQRPRAAAEHTTRLEFRPPRAGAGASPSRGRSPAPRRRPPRARTRAMRRHAWGERRRSALPGIPFAPRRMRSSAHPCCTASASAARWAPT